MNAVVESSLVVGWLRRVVSSSVVCAFLAAVVRPVLRAARYRRGKMAPRAVPRDEAAVTAVVNSSCLLTAVEGCFITSSMAWRHSAAGGFMTHAFHQVRALEPWQRVCLIGWMLLVAVLIYGLLVGFDDLFASSVALMVWGGLLVLALGLMWGCRAVALAWVHRGRG